MHKIIRISLSAALVSAKLSGAAYAAYQPEDFDRIESLIEDGNWVALRTYINENPRILDCNDQLAEELRRFLNDSTGLYAVLTFEESMYPDISLRTQVPDNCVTVAETPAADPGPVARDDDGGGSSAPATARAAAAPSIY